LFVDGGPDETFDIAFPVLHGPYGEDGCTQGLLELANVPYVGSGVVASALAMDKALMKQVLRDAELPVVRHHVFRGVDWREGRDEHIEACEELGYPLFVKPANLGSSLGIGKAGDRAALVAAIEEALLFDTKLVVEAGLVGAREIECSVYGNDDPRVSLPGEIVVHHRDGFYSYDAKYLDAEGASLEIPAKLYHAEMQAVQLVALRAYRALGCAGLARVDLFVTAEHEIVVNEVNTIPGFTAISMYPRLWQASGVGAVELVTTLLELSRQRHTQRRNLRTTR
jgi:D-alanine-D-alanine ligase